MKRPLSALLGAVALAAQPLPALAQSTLGDSSLASVIGSVIVVAGTASILEKGAEFVVEGVQASAKGTVLALKRVSDGAKVSVEVSAEVVKGLAIGSGTLIAVVAIASGLVLVKGSEVIAHIPNEIGKGLVHHSPVP